MCFCNQINNLSGNFKEKQSVYRPKVQSEQKKQLAAQKVKGIFRHM